MHHKGTRCIFKRRYRHGRIDEMRLQATLTCKELHMMYIMWSNKKNKAKWLNINATSSVTLIALTGLVHAHKGTLYIV